MPVILTACAVLFDMDGTIVDSSVPIRTCWGQRADRHGLDALPAGRWGIVTSAALEVCKRRLVAAGLPIPDVIVSSADVPRGKPAPDGYRLGAARLGFAPADCLACEVTTTPDAITLTFPA